MGSAMFCALSEVGVQGSEIPIVSASRPPGCCTGQQKTASVLAVLPFADECTNVLAKLYRPAAT